MDRKTIRVALTLGLTFVLGVLGGEGTARAIFVSVPTGARPQSMGGAYTGVADDAHAVFFNPGGLTQVKEYQASFTYTQFFRTSDLAQGVGTVVLPLGKFGLDNLGTAGLTYSQFGKSDLEKETMFIGTWAFPLLSDVSVGANLKALHLAFGGGFGSATKLGVDVGALVEVKKVKKGLRLGVFFKNVNRPTFGKDFPEDAPRELTAGLSFRAYPTAMTTIDFTKEVGRDEPQWKVGQEFEIAKILYLRAGAQSAPQRFSFGGGIKISPILLDYAFYSHAVLPSTHLFTAGFRFGGPKKK